MSSAPSPRPIRATAHLEPEADPSIVDRILDAPDWPELKSLAEIALGPDSFELGVCYGIVENLASSVTALFGLLKTFILAGLYVRANRAPAWWDVLGLPEYLAAKGAELVLGAQLKQAHDQCEALMREVMYAVKNPQQFLKATTDHYVRQYVEKWEIFQQLVLQTNLTSQFRSGEMFGSVLLDVLMLVTAALGAGEAAAKLVAEVPELVDLAGNLKTVLKVKPGGLRLGAVEAGAEVDVAEVRQASIQEPKLPVHGPPSKSFDGTVVRATNPKFASSAYELSPGNIAADHRYSAPGRGAIYAATSDGALRAEMDHYGIDMKTQEMVPKDIHLKNVLDLTDRKTLDSLGITESQITGDDYTITHAIGDWARGKYDAILAPSARAKGTSNLVILK